MAEVKLPAQNGPQLWQIVPGLWVTPSKVRAVAFLKDETGKAPPDKPWKVVLQEQLVGEAWVWFFRTKIAASEWVNTLTERINRFTIEERLFAKLLAKPLRRPRRRVAR